MCHRVQNFATNKVTFLRTVVLGAAHSLECTVMLLIGGIMFRLLLKEKCSFLLLCAIIVATIGVYLVVQPDFTPNRYKFYSHICPRNITTVC